MHVLIKMSEKGRIAHSHKSATERARHHDAEWVQYVNPTTDEQVKVCRINGLLNWGHEMCNHVVLGNYARSSITALPYVVPIFYDEEPAIYEVYQQLEIMAEQFREITGLGVKVAS